MKHSIAYRANSYIIVVDNAPEDDETIELLHQINQIEVIKNNRNMGIAKALNIGIERAGNYGYEKIFLFDQDSSISSFFLANMNDFYEQCSNNVALVGTNFYDVNSKTYAKYAQIDTFRYRSVMRDSQNQLDVSFAITSGALISYAKFLKIGFFREDYFIDHVDSEYCLRTIDKLFIDILVILSQIIIKYLNNNKISRSYLFIAEV